MCNTYSLFVTLHMFWHQMHTFLTEHVKPFYCTHVILTVVSLNYHILCKLCRLCISHIKIIILPYQAIISCGQCLMLIRMLRYYSVWYILIWLSMYIWYNKQIKTNNNSFCIRLIFFRHTNVIKPKISFIINLQYFVTTVEIWNIEDIRFDIKILLV